MVCFVAVSDQVCESAEDTPVKLRVDEKLRFISKATQTAADVPSKAIENEGECDREQVDEDKSAHVQITASLSEVRNFCIYAHNIYCFDPGRSCLPLTGH